MENKLSVQIFTIALALASLYTLSFNWASKNFEETARTHGEYIADGLEQDSLLDGLTWDEAAKVATRKYLRDSVEVIAYEIPFFVEKSYREVKEEELNLGLDLRGGMSVTLEVSLPDLMIALSDYSSNEGFRNAISTAKQNQKNSTSGFMELFEEAWSDHVDNSAISDSTLWRIFHNMEQKDLFPAKSSDEEIFVILDRESETAIDNTESIIRKRIDQLGVAQPNVQKLQNGRILVELPGVDDRERARKQLKSTANLEFWVTYFNDEVINRILTASAELGKERNPELYGEDSPADTALTQEQFNLKNPIFALLRPTRNRSAIVGVAFVNDTTAINKLLKSPIAIEALKNAKGEKDLRLLWDAKSNNNEVLLYAIKDESGKGKAKLTGKSIIDARVSYDEIGDVVVSMTMNGEGTGVWGQMTKECASQNNRAVAVVLDNMVFSAPNVQSAITSGRSQISFGSNQTASEKLVEAEDLSSLLKAGSLPAPARIVDEVSIGPQLGKANIDAGLSSFIIALLIVLLYMIFYYNGAGVVSNIALIANLFFLIGALSALGAALTLPGIAGIVLTIGMAVDANVLIYERIREEMRNGKGLSVAVKEGYSKAYSAIFDANITTLLTAIVLYTFGSGAIKGFATTLIIGIFTSLFSAIVITRLVILSRLEKGKSISFSTKITENWFTNSKIDFLGKRKYMYVFSSIIILIGVWSLSTRGLNEGVEFTGGTTFDITFAEEIDVDEVRESLALAFSEDGTKGNPIVQTKDSDQRVRVMTNFMLDSDSEDVDAIINAQLAAGLANIGSSYEIDMYNKVDSTISDDFKTGAKKATIFSLIIIFLYIVFRFRKWQYGLGALIATSHDVLIVLSVFSIFWGILPFTMEIDQAFIAAILTVIGYSINDTVVVFDRIREYVGKLSGKTDDTTIINDALNSTLSRTINTSLSTFVVLLTIFCFGGDNIKGFIFALMVGVVVGTYSSIFIATPCVHDLSKSRKK